MQSTSITPLGFENNLLENPSGVDLALWLPGPTQQTISSYNCVNCNPNLVNPPYDFHLPFFSPCRDAGNNNATPMTTNDLDGNNRINYTTDMGAYEYYQTKESNLTDESDQFSLKSNDINMYPNPAKDIVRLDIRDLDFVTFTVRVFSLTGKLILEKTIDRTDTTPEIELSALSNGIYMLELAGNLYNTHKKLIIRH